MTFIQFLILAMVAALVTLPAVLLIPRARQSPWFDRGLSGATWLLAFFGALAAPSYVAADSPLNRWTIGGVALFPALIGAAIGALSINLVLWMMDRFSPAPVEELNRDEEEDGRDSIPPSQPH